MRAAGRDEHAILMALAVMLAATQTNNTGDKLLDVCGLLPQRRRSFSAAARQAGQCEPRSRDCQTSLSP